MVTKALVVVWRADFIMRVFYFPKAFWRVSNMTMNSCHLNNLDLWKRPPTKACLDQRSYCYMAFASLFSFQNWRRSTSSTKIYSEWTDCNKSMAFARKMDTTFEGYRKCFIEGHKIASPITCWRPRKIEGELMMTIISMALSSILSNRTTSLTLGLIHIH